MFRKFLGLIKKLMLKNRFTTVLGVFLKWFFKVGPKSAVAHVKHYTAFSKYAIATDVSRQEREEQENYKFGKSIKFSVLVPIYNTPEKFLREMIESVISQTYKNFELCLADGSDKEHGFVGDICREYAQKDERIKYKILSENKGIAENTNECIKMSSGDYIALFDHDDILHPSALFEVAKVIEAEDADFVYTDEVTFDGEKGLKAIFSSHYKPDFSYYNLLANNYICHFSVFRASLVDKVGMFRGEYDGSQDHDMILRLTSAAKKVSHIPKMLYFWRSHENSVAKDIGSKPYAIKSGINLVSNHLKERGISAKVEVSPAFPSIYRVNYEIVGNPFVSVVISSDKAEGVKASVKSILEKTAYDNFEIILVVTTNIYNLCNNEFANNSNVKIFEYKDAYEKVKATEFGVQKAKGDYLLFFEAGCRPVESIWLEELLAYAQLDGVGAVGSKVVFKSGTVKSSGKIIGTKGKTVADRHGQADKSELGYFGKLFYAQNVSAVACECLMVKRTTFEAVDGFDTQFENSLYNTDLCLKLIKIGKQNITNPYSVVTCSSVVAQENIKEYELFNNKWADFIEKGDPYYNKALPDNYFYF